MKCVKNIEGGEINRVNDAHAEKAVNSGYWKYVPKSEWKARKEEKKSKGKKSK